MGIEPGDRVATQLVLVPEHMALMYACFKIGAILAPLDVRLQLVAGGKHRPRPGR